MITAVLTSDNHLGANYARFRPDRLELRRKRLREAFQCVVDAAIERKVDLFLHAGDLFDRPDPRNEERYFVAQQLHRLQQAKIPVFAIAGNHDTPRSYGYGGGITPQQEADALGGLHLFRDMAHLEFKEITVRGQHVRIWGMSSDFNRTEEVCPLEGLTLGRETPDIAQILLLHYGIQDWMARFEEDSREPILSQCNLERMQVDLIGVGHLHRRKHRTLGSGALLVNPGSTERMDFGEEALECGFAVITLEGTSVSMESVTVPSQPMRTLDLELPSAIAQIRQTAQQANAAATLLNTWQDAIKQASHANQLLRVRVSGQMPRWMYHAFEWQELQKTGNALNFYCQIETDRMVVFDPDGNLPLGYGVSFDVGEELQNIARGLRHNFEGDAEEQELYDLALEEINKAFDRATGGARN